MKTKNILLIIFFLTLPMPILAQDGSIDPGGSVPRSTSGGALPSPSPKSSVSPTITVQQTIPVTQIPTPTAVQSQTISPQASSSQASTAGSGLIATLLGVGSGALIAGILFFKTKKKKDVEKTEGKCNNIRSLLEQKKQELEEYIKTLPEEKVKQMAQEKALDVLKKDEHTKSVLNSAENIKAKYDKLKETIEMLENRYNLCMLSLPETGEATYEGTIVENSLSDKKILENIKIIKTYQNGGWTVHDVEVNKKQVEKLGQSLSDGPWYMHFWRKDADEVVAAFKDKNFKLKASNKDTWTEAIKHGQTKSIPKEQLDFIIK